MVAEAEEFAEEDRKVKERVDQRNKLEGYAYNLRNQINDEESGIGDKLDAEDRETLEEAVKDVLDWLDENDEAEAEEMEEKYKELEEVAKMVEVASLG